MLKYVFPLCLVLLPYSGWANSLDSALLNCKKITHDDQRLACFDQIQLTSGSAETAAAEAVVVAAPVAAKSQTVLTEDDFGLEHKSAVKDKLQTNTTVQLTKLTKTPFGLLIFSFENGQIWRQVSKETFSAKTGKTYILERAAFNSFFLSEEGGGRKTRVRRDQ
ncbi:MAG: hypothetical protein A2203_08620 [Chromatiales bacterium RIFOXYA1_FULL_46_5]|nr:MAG: hypothetical protein A2203_08620 [Chromatiales bacterium RIFOXYA1_FULL_46_5]